VDQRPISRSSPDRDVPTPAARAPRAAYQREYLNVRDADHDAIYYAHAYKY
jgi:hypothetical protein